MAFPGQAQQRPPPPSQALSLQLDISFLHPGYAVLNQLLSLPRADCTAPADGTPPCYGVHHRTALLACQIIAGNAFQNSYLAYDKEGQQRVQVLPEGILTDNEYYFIVEGSERYPIVPSFRDWEFPHNSIPDSWLPTTSTLTTTCSVTNSSHAIEAAHLIPKEEQDWYIINKMRSYGLDLQDINNQGNLLPLRKDIHHVFDARWFVIVPKTVATTSSQPSLQYVTHIITRSAAELWPTHQNILVGSLQSSSHAYLFARFAWAILFKVKPFITERQGRYVIRLFADTSIGQIEYKQEFYTGKYLDDQYGGGGSKTATPKKRKSGPGSTADHESAVDLSDEDSDLSMEEMDDIWDLPDDERKRRKQESSEETAPGVGPDRVVHLAPDIEADLKEALQRGEMAQNDSSRMVDE